MSRNWGTIMSNMCVVKNRFFDIFHIYMLTLGTEWYPFLIKKYEVAAFEIRIEHYHTMFRSIFTFS